MATEKSTTQQQPNRNFVVKDNIIIGNDPPEMATNSISKLLLNSMNSYPDSVGIIDADTDEKIKFLQMRDRSIRCAVWLKKQGITRNDIVSYSTPNQVNDYVPFFATLYVGAIANPWHYKFTKANAKYFLDLMQPKVIFACKQSVDALSEVAEEMMVDCKFVVFGKHPKFVSLTDILAEQSQEEVDNFKHVEIEDPGKQVGLILFTSGTMGNQKAIMLSYESLLVYYPMPRGMVGLWYTPLLWVSASVFVLLLAYSGGVRVIHSAFDPDKTSEVIEKYRINWTLFNPRIMISMCKGDYFSKYDFSSLLLIVTGGSVMSKSILTNSQKVLKRTFICNSYGLTEAGGVVTRLTKICKKIESAGHVIEGVTMKVIDTKTGNALGPNQTGEICLKTKKLMLGYYKNPAETRKVIDDEGWLHTGDLGYYDDNAEILITGRLNEVIVTENYKLFLAEIAGILLEHPEVQQAAVISVPGGVDAGEQPFAFIVKTPGAKITEEELKELPGSYNKFYRVSGGVAFVNELPYTVTEKVNVGDLKEKAKAYI